MTLEDAPQCTVTVLQGTKTLPLLVNAFHSSVLAFDERRKPPGRCKFIAGPFLLPVLLRVLSPKLVP